MPRYLQLMPAAASWHSRSYSDSGPGAHLVSARDAPTIGNMHSSAQLRRMAAGTSRRRSGMLNICIDLSNWASGQHATEGWVIVMRTARKKALVCRAGTMNSTSNL